MSAIRAIQKQLQEICRRYQIEAMYAYGSRSQEVKNYVDSRGQIDKTTSSDVDIGVKIFANSNISIRDKVGLAIELEDLLNVHKVDLAILQEVDAFVAANIIRGERLYCEDEYLADEYELYVLRRAGDLAPLERERLSIIFREHE